MACRFFLGIFEAGLGLGVIYYLSFFYMRHELGFRIGLQLACAPLANTFAGALAYGITSGHSALANWKLLFMVEGLPNFILSVLAWYFLPDTPTKARFLNEEEKSIVLARAVRQVGDEEATNRLGHLRGKDVWEALLDYKNWITAVCLFHAYSHFEPF